MVIDTLHSLPRYVALHPLFADVLDFLQHNALDLLPEGRHDIIPGSLYVNIELCQPKDAEQAVLESHRRMIDIQIPITSPETYGYSPVAMLREEPYDSGRDIIFYPHDNIPTLLSLQPGQFAIFFPEDGHAPAVTPQAMRKAIFKVKL